MMIIIWFYRKKKNDSYNNSESELRTEINLIIRFINLCIERRSTIDLLLSST